MVTATATMYLEYIPGKDFPAVLRMSYLSTHDALPIQNKRVDFGGTMVVDSM